ncbi:MAG TPA: cytochrome b N-terminal domain-containing protein [Coleofasciculaceae cyanobacterium]|jgi:cytochrome b6
MVSVTKVFDWLDQRLSIRTWQQLAEKKTVPIHRHSVWYYLGGIALVLLLVQVATGGLLMVYYIPELASAHASILKINTQINFGWFIRSLHSWGANIMILALFVHLFSTYFMKAYRPPRELTWLTGLALMVLAFGFGFTGYLLPWDEVSFFATKIGIDITSKTPFIGEFMASMLRGGPEVGQATLSRFFVIHIFLLPLGLLALLGVHLLMIQLHGISEPDAVKALPEAQKESEKFFPTFVLKDLMVWLLVLNALSVLVGIFPWGLGPEADPYAPAPEGIKPEWYFLAMFQFLKLMPPTIGPLEGEQVGMMIFGIIGLLFAAMPFIDRGHNPKLSGWARLFGQIVLVGFVFFTIWGFAS